MNLRFIERDGKKILQYENIQQEFGKDQTVLITNFGWQDVPLVEEPKKAREWWLSMASGSFFPYAPPTNNDCIAGLIRVREVLGDEK